MMTAGFKGLMAGVSKTDRITLCVVFPVSQRRSVRSAQSMSQRIYKHATTAGINLSQRRLQ